MAKVDSLRDNLPYLYRPEQGDGSLIEDYLAALGEVMDISSAQMNAVMQSHWLSFSDKATFDDHALRDRQRRGLPPFNVRDPDDQLEINRYPYITDLARLGQLIPIAPWKEPLNQKDLVENYRRRIRKIVSIYRNGLGTFEALRAMVETELPLALELGLEARFRSFAMEEGISFETIADPVEQNGIPADKVGPLMRWSVFRESARPSLPQIFIEGLAPETDEIEATELPMIEHYQPDGTGLVGLAIGYDGTLADGEALLIKAARRTWLLIDGVLHVSPEVTDENANSDPSANGTWHPVADAPAVRFDQLLQTPCGSLWLAGEQQLWRCTPQGFRRVLESEALAPINQLLVRNGVLYLATDQGLSTISIYPADSVYALTNIPAFSGVALRQIADFDNQLWVAGDNGLTFIRFDSNDLPQVEPAVITIPCHSMLFENSQWLVGCELGLLRFDVASQAWHAYQGETEEQPDQQWLPVELDALPPADDLFLPTITRIAKTRDEQYWFGSDHGLCRYYGRQELGAKQEHSARQEPSAGQERGLLYRSTLQAYPDLIAGNVNHLHVDDRGMLWIASSTGLFRYDGRDIAQRVFADNRWQQLGRADSVYPTPYQQAPRGNWRFAKSDNQWQQQTPERPRWTPSNLATRSSVQLSINNALPTDSIIAHLGEFDGSVFTPIGDALANSSLFMRAKPDQQTIVDGGFPRLPELPSGTSVWRYLRREAEGLTPPTEGDLPWWSSEGRLFPPPGFEDIHPGRYRSTKEAIDGRFDESVYAYCPAAKVTFQYHDAPAFGVCVRLFLRDQNDSLDPIIAQRVLAGINRVRPAGIPIKLLLEGKTIEPPSP